MQKTDTQFLQADSWSQEPITRSLHLPYILESTFARIFLFLEQFSPQFHPSFTPGQLKFQRKHIV